MIVAPTAEQSEGGLKKELGGIAELAGIDLGGGGGRKVEAMAILKSKGFVRHFIVENNLMPILLLGTLGRECQYLAQGRAKASDDGNDGQKIHRQATVDENIKAGLVTIHFDWYSPDRGEMDERNDRYGERPHARADINSAEK